MSQAALNASVDAASIDHHLPMDNTSGAATDRIGSLTMAQIGSPTLRQPGPAGSGSFSWSVLPSNHPAVTAFVDVGDVNGHGFTIGVWFKRVPEATTPLGATREILVQIGSTTDKGLCVALQTSTSTFSLVRWGVGALDTGVSITPYLDGEWHLAVISFTVADVMTLLLDGVAVKSYFSPGFFKPTVAGLSVGVTDTNAFDFTGDLSNSILRLKEGITEAQSLDMFNSAAVAGDKILRPNMVI